MINGSYKTNNDVMNIVYFEIFLLYVLLSNHIVYFAAFLLA